MEIFRSGKMVINSHITGDGAFISGSSTSTGSFGLILQNGNELSTFLGDRLVGDRNSLQWFGFIDWLFSHKSFCW